MSHPRPVVTKAAYTTMLTRTLLTCGALLVLCTTAHGAAPNRSVLGGGGDGGSAATTVPPEWAAAVARGDMLYADTNPGSGYFPYVGNGYVATELLTGTMYLAGVFNGLSNSTPSHRAAIPSPANIHLPPRGMRFTGAALDLRNGAFYNRTVCVTGSCAGLAVQQTW